MLIGLAQPQTDVHQAFTQLVIRLALQKNGEVPTEEKEHIPTNKGEQERFAPDSRERVLNESAFARSLLT